VDNEKIRGERVEKPDIDDLIFGDVEAKTSER